MEIQFCSIIIYSVYNLERIQQHTEEKLFLAIDLNITLEKQANDLKFKV